MTHTLFASFDDPTDMEAAMVALDAAGTPAEHFRVVVHRGALERAPSSPLFGFGAGARFVSLPRGAVREIVARQPALARLALETHAEGEVFGPYQAGRALHLVRVDAFVPARDRGRHRRGPRGGRRSRRSS